MWDIGSNRRPLLPLFVLFFFFVITSLLRSFPMQLNADFLALSFFFSFSYLFVHCYSLERRVHVHPLLCVNVHGWGLLESETPVFPALCRVVHRSFTFVASAAAFIASHRVCFLHFTFFFFSSSSFYRWTSSLTSFFSITLPLP